MELYEPFKSTRKNKKYNIYVLDNNNKKKKISFGDTRYEHYFDKLGKYKHLCGCVNIVTHVRLCDSR